MNEFLIVVLIVFWGWISSYFAGQRRRNPYWWFLWGVLFGPFTLVALFLMKDFSEKGKESAPEIKEINVAHHSPFEHLDWYYLNQKRETIGPISFSQLKEEWDQSNLSENSYVWNDTIPEWKKVNDINELKEELNRNHSNEE